MRAMGVYPTEKQWVKDMLDEIQVRVCTTSCCSSSTLTFAA